ncbi:MAG: hypothetical protein PHD92_04930 [Eubacteriales bacterium]|jgi:hypothetical protein|nr:hypothetical protein [Eubacteriales bacterium]
MKTTINPIHKGYFDLYPSSKQLFFTDDGNCFLEKSPAVDHATKSKQKWLVVDNPRFIKEVEEDVEQSEQVMKEARLSAAMAKLAKVDLPQISYADACVLASDLNLELADRKKETVFAALDDKLIEITKKSE